MTFLLGAGVIRIDVTVSRALACSVAVKANRPQGLTRMFVGRRPEEAPVLAGQVFSLCSFSQSVAARLAVLNAADLPMGDDERRRAAAGLLAERIFESLRALILHWPVSMPEPLTAAAGKHLREALAASQAIIAEVKAKDVDRQRLAAAAARLSGAATGLGIPAQGSIPLAGTACAAILGDAASDHAFAGRRPDRLTIADDAEVVARLCDEADYAALPHLSGRIAETGAYSRPGGADGNRQSSHLADRFLARTGDVGRCLEALHALVEAGEQDWALLADSGPSPGAGGYGAVECARGRLYHQAELGADGRLSAYRILAPTEWNFHPAGPFVETVLSSRIGTGEMAVRSVSRLAVLFDPCVAFEVDVREATHA